MSKPKIELYEFKGKPGYVVSPKAPKPVGPYPHARIFGDLVFVSGVGPRKLGSDDIPGVTWSETGDIQHDVAVQTESVIENITYILEEAGSSLKNVIDVQVFLTNMERDFKDFNKVYEKHFAEIGPARTTVEVGSLPTPICVELKVIASLKGQY
jgi:2-aminomuconate deaminase